MFQTVCRSLSGALTVFAASGLHTHVVTGRSQLGVSCLSLQVLLNQMAAFVLYSFLLVFVYFCGLFGVYKSNINGSVHRSIIQ
jgi:hypothetical protein